MKRKGPILCLICALGLAACAGEDYTPVYFPGVGGKKEAKAKAKDPNLADGDARCQLELESTLCVKIKGEEIEVGIDPAEPLCATVPPIPITIEGEGILLKGSDFPDVQVHVNIKGVDTPMTINGRANEMTRDNNARGHWSPDGDITFNDFTFYLHVLGMTGKITNLNITTGEAKKTPHLPPLEGMPADNSGEIRLVTATVLGHIMEVADKFLMGASLQAEFEGTLTPSLSECLGNKGAGPSLKITKLHDTPSGEPVEDPIPGENTLEISHGTFIARGEGDFGPSFEGRASFRITNEGKEPVAVTFPNLSGPFRFEVGGKTKTVLEPGQSVPFEIIFRPSKSNVPQAGLVREEIRLGKKRFTLTGIALDAGGKAGLAKVDENGKVAAAGVEALELAPLSVPAGSLKNFFHCRAITCDNRETVTACLPCSAPAGTDCRLYAVNAEGRPVEETDAQCRLLHPDSLPRMTLNLAGSDTVPLKPSKQVLALRNFGVEPMIVRNIAIVEIPGSRSRGEFHLLKNELSFPITLPPHRENKEETTLLLTITYFPKDLTGSDGKQATSGQEALDRAVLRIETDSGIREIALSGKTRIQETPELQVYLATATGLKGKAQGESFSFEEVTAKTRDLGVPVFLKLSDTASAGLRIRSIRIAGKDAARFEWLDTKEKLERRQPPAGEGKRCSLPIFDPTTGRMIDELFDLDFAAPGSQGFDLKPGVFTTATMPLFGCLNFHREPEEAAAQRHFSALLAIRAQRLDPHGRLAANPDGSFQEMEMTLPVVAAVDPMRGKYVVRITQSLAAILNPTAPSLAAMPAKREVDRMVREGRGSTKELSVMMGAVQFDPFDEMALTDSKGEAVSVPGDGVTAVFRKMDTRPASVNYEEEHLFDYASLMHDSTLPEGERGVFEDYLFDEHPLPDPLKVGGWRIFTGALSFPGPFHRTRSPINIDECDIIDPCSPEGLSKFTEAGAGGPDGRGACAFFYPSGGSYRSPAFQRVVGGERVDLCTEREKPQEIRPMDNGLFQVDGSLTFQDVGLRFWGPNYFLNPAGPLGALSPMDEVFHVAFTTETIRPALRSNEPVVIPDERIDFAKQEHKMNLNMEGLSNPPICKSNTRNRTIGGKTYSTWKYFAPLLFKDEAGEIPAGCPEPGNGFKGGTAFIRGRRVDPETGVFTLAMVAKFGNREELSPAFQNIVIAIAMNGWMCNPQGEEEEMEGSRCFDATFNERDAASQISFIGENE